MAKGLLSKEDADKLAIAYTPQKFAQRITASASHFVAMQSSGNVQMGSDFRIDRLVAEQTGVAELERLSLEEKVERGSLARIKELQEDAYQQAYSVGRSEGQESALAEFRAQLDEKLVHFDELLGSVAKLKSELVSSNEAQIVHLVYYLAKRIALAEIVERPELILQIVKDAIHDAQSEEKVTVRVSQSDLDFIESTQAQLGKEFSSLREIKLEANEEITSGGCIIATNYGEVNATLEKRVDKLWLALNEKIPKLKDSVGP
jgi:flagellar assembly protein FliH